MKKLLILLLVSLLPLTGFSQQIDRVYKENGVWKGDISGPITNYPKQGVVIVDTTSIPDPVPIPPPVVYTNVDNINPHIVYTGTGWYNGNTTATGFEGNTMAYNSTAGATSTLIFDGTYLEAYLEYKATAPAHGSGKLKIDNLPDTTINFGLSTSNGSKLVYKRKLPPGQHTFTLTVVGTGNVVFDYVKINGQTVTPPVTPIPPDPIPPTGIVIQPGTNTIKNAIESAGVNKTYSLLQGTYNETLINVPSGVNIIGAGVDKTIINFVGAQAFQSDQAIFMVKGGAGNQTLSDFTIRGANSANGGITIERSGVKVLRVKIQECRFYAIWPKNSPSVEIAYSEFINTSYASSGWCTGQIIMFNLTGLNIHDNKFSSNNPNQGYGISVYGNPQGQAFPMSGRIYNNTVAMHPSSIWAGGKSPNIGIEFHDVRMAGVEIDHNTIRNVLSIDPNYPTYAGRTNVHDNEFIMGGSSFAIELATSNISITNNNFSQTSIMTADFEATGKHTDIIIDGNTFISNNANPSWGGTWLIGSDGIQMLYRNNKITKGNYPLFFYDDGSSPSKSQLTDGGGNVIK